MQSDAMINTEVIAEKSTAEINVADNDSVKHPSEATCTAQVLM